MKPQRNYFQFIMIPFVVWSICFSTLSLADETLTMPADLQIIDTEAFYRDQSIDRVVLGSQVREIRSRAFADSSLTSINLPNSLTYIADDAFDGPDQVLVSANEGSYAYAWAVSHGYLLSAPIQNDPDGLNRKVTVSWNPVDKASSYNIYYNTVDSFSGSEEITDIAAAGSYTIPDLFPGTTYYTWVKAVGPTGISAASNMKSTITYPSAPVLNEPEVSGNSIILSWSPVKGADLYRLYYSTANNFDTAARIVSIKGTSWTISELEYNTTYYFWISSVNASGGMRTIASKAAATASDPSAPVQNAPKGLSKGVTVFWNDVANAQSYSIFYSTTDDIAESTEISGITGTNSYTITDLLPGTIYYTWVKAVTASGVTGASNMKHVITYPSAPSLNTPEVSGNTIHLSWNTVTGATIYRLHYNTVNNFDTSSKIDSIKTTSYTITGLDFDTTYYIWIAAANTSGGKRTTNPKEVTTGNDPLIPTQTDSAGYIKQITVNWNAVSDAQSYIICYGTSSDISKATEITGITSSGSYTIPDLFSGTVYYTWVKAVNGGNVSVPSNRKSVITFPEAPTLNTPQVSGNSITLSWNEVAGASVYRLKYGKSSNSSEATQIDHIKTTSYTIKNLDYDTTYYIWIISANASGGLRNPTAKTATTQSAP